MDPEFLDHPGQGVSDLQACYAHALAGLVKAGTDLDQVGTELNRAQINFYNAIDDYFHQLQLQIDNKDKAIRLLSEQKIETYGVMSQRHKELMKLQDENTTLRTRNGYLTGILNASSSSTGDPLPAGSLQGNFSGISSTGFFAPSHNSQFSKLADDTLLDNIISLLRHAPPNRRFTSSSNGDHGRDTLEVVPYRAKQKEQERQSHDDEACETWRKSTKHTCPGETAAYLPLQDARERQVVVRERLNYDYVNAEGSMQEVIRQAQERLNHNPASTLGDQINSNLKEETAHERLAEAEEARSLVREAWKKSSIDTGPDATRAIPNNTSSSDVLARRPQAQEMEVSNRRSTVQDPSQYYFQSQVSQQKKVQKASSQHARARDVNAGPWANYKQGSTTEAKESFRRQQATHGWTVTTDDKGSQGSIADDPSEAIQPTGRVPKLKADLESPPRKDHLVSALDPRSPSFVPSPDKHGAAVTGRQTPPHKWLSKPDNLNADLDTASTIINPAAVDSNPRNKTITPPHKRFPVASGAHKKPALVDADTDLIALEDEIDPVTAIHQYTFKATTRKDHALAPLDVNTPKPFPTISKDFNDVTNRAPTSSSLEELTELQTEARSLPPSYNAALDPKIFTTAPSQVRLERVYKQAHDSSEPPAKPSSSSTSLPAVDSALGTGQGLSLIVKPKMLPVKQQSTPVLASSPVRSEINKMAHNTTNATTETTILRTSAKSNFDTPFEDDPFAMAEHKIDSRAERQGHTPIVNKAPTPTLVQHLNPPKENKDPSAAFMAAAQSNFSTFATKYGRDPEADTRKELAAKGRALKEKLANEASTSDVGASVREPEEQYRYPAKDSHRPPILGTHDLGGGLDDQSYDFVIRPDSRGEWFEMDLDWKAVVKDGETRYIL